MKKSALTIAASLFFSAFTMAVVPQVNGNGQGSDDNSDATHGVSIQIQTLALVDIESIQGGEADVINLSPTISSLEAGEAVDFSTATNSDLWLNYTSIVGANGNGNGHGNNQREITVELNNDNALPKGVSLLVSAGDISSGQGEKGSPVKSKIEIKKNPKTLISGIGSCFTESGPNKGHRLTYELSMKNNDYDKLLADTYDLVITYTITGN
jgi:hypothetical protein